MNPTPLAGITVVELAHNVAGPYAGQVLADLGAEVVKIERPDGDDARKWGPPFLDGAGPSFHAVNRNKRSAVCDLRDAAQRAALVRYIVERADVVLQAMRPGQVEALGLDAATLRAGKPSLVYCNLGAFGARGPLSGRPGYDALMQAFAGIMSVTGEEGRSPVRVGPSLVDMGSSLWAVIGILCALARRRETGKGSVVDVSLFETAAAWMGPYAVQYLASGEVPKRGGSGRVEIVPYQAYPAADGDFVIGAANDGLFRRLSDALGRPEWAEDVRFRTNADRVRNHAALDALIEAETRRRSRAEWCAILEAAGVPCAPVQDVRELLEHEQLRALGLLQSVPGSRIPLIGLPISFDGERPVPRSGAPVLGEHTAKVLSP